MPNDSNATEMINGKAPADGLALYLVLKTNEHT